MADGKRYADDRKNLLPAFLVSKKTKWNGEKPHTQIETRGAPSPELREVLRDTYFKFKNTRGAARHEMSRRGNEL